MKYFIPDGIIRAELRITDVAGRLLKSITVDARGAAKPFWTQVRWARGRTNILYTWTDSYWKLNKWS